MKYFGLSHDNLERFDGNVTWFKKFGLKHLLDPYDGNDWPFWKDSIVTETPFVDGLYDHILTDYHFSYINMVYRMPPPLYCVSDTLVSLIGDVLFEQAFWRFHFESPKGMIVQGWKCIKEKPDVRLREEQIESKSGFTQMIHTAEDYPLILTQSLYEQINGLKFHECSWVQLI